MKKKPSQERKVMPNAARTNERVSKDAVTGAHRAVETSDLIEAVKAIYYAAHWSPDRPVDAATLWENLRNAAGLTKGNAPKPIETSERETMLDRQLE